jgi:hypothetical protein
MRRILVEAPGGVSSGAECQGRVQEVRVSQQREPMSMEVFARGVRSRVLRGAHVSWECAR